MFDAKNDIDILIRSVLADAQEDVPSHIWDNISSEMDVMVPSRNRRKTVMLWLGRSAISIAAAAVAVLGIFFGTRKDTDIMNAGSEKHMIAVVRPEVNVTADFGKIRPLSAGRIAGTASDKLIADASIHVQESRSVTHEMMKEGTPEKQESVPTYKTDAEVIPDLTLEDDWPEEKQTSGWRPSIAVVISGSAGTNSTQGHTPGPLKSPSISNMVPNTGITQKGSDHSYGLPMSFGAGVRIGISPRWSLGTGISYTLLTRKFFGTYVSISNDGKIAESIPSDIRNTQHYIGIPVNAYYNIINNSLVNFYAYAGGTVERCVADKYEILTNSHIHTDKAKGVQISAGLGIGVEFVLSRNLGLYFDPSLRYYFDCGQPKSIRTAQPLMLGLEMGLRVNL